MHSASICYVRGNDLVSMTQARRLLFRLVSSVHYCAAVGLFSVHGPHDSFVTVIDVAGVRSRINEDYRIRFEEPFTHHLITRRHYSDRF